MMLMHLVNVTGPMSVTFAKINWFVGTAVWSDNEFNFEIPLVISYRQFSSIQRSF